MYNLIVFFCAVDEKMKRFSCKRKSYLRMFRDNKRHLLAGSDALCHNKQRKMVTIKTYEFYFRQNVLDCTSNSRRRLLAWNTKKLPSCFKVCFILLKKNSRLNEKISISNVKRRKNWAETVEIPLHAHSAPTQPKKNKYSHSHTHSHISKTKKINGRHGKRQM